MKRRERERRRAEKASAAPTFDFGGALPQSRPAPRIIGTGWWEKPTITDPLWCWRHVDVAPHRRPAVRDGLCEECLAELRELRAKGLL